MIIFPIGREGAVLQRRAWVTYTLIALNVAAFLLFCAGTSDREDIETLHEWRETVAFARDRPSLNIPPDIIDMMPRDLRLRPLQPAPSFTDVRATRDQQTLDSMAHELRQRYQASSFFRLAYVPAVGSIASIFTSMFLHAGLFHLLGNMIFLFATAPFIEDAFRRPLFTILYFSGGVLATLTFGALHPDSLLPLVGASGAIAAVMGAYLVRFTLSRVRFLLIPIVFVPFWNFRFSLPALVVLPLWFLEQLVSIPAEGDSGVAVTAHVAGFAYGVLFAFIVRLFSAPEVAVKPFAQKAIETDPLRLELDAAIRKNNAQQIDIFSTRLLEQYAAADPERAKKLIAELRNTRDLRQFLDRAAKLMERWGDRDQQMVLLQQLVENQRGTAESIPTMVKLAMAQRAAGDHQTARQTLASALDDPACSPEWRRRVESGLAAL
ncbi:MAG TPA: rhomboid family intramembrane serine protease [Thermoanaerobaculia bacterium]